MYRLILDYLMSPFLLLMALTGLGLLNLWRQCGLSHRGVRWAGLPFLLLVCSSTPAFVYPLLGSLEWQHAELSTHLESGATIVVLGGYVEAPREEGRDARLGSDSMNRCLWAAELYAQTAKARLVITGGKVEPAEPGPAIAEAMAAFLVRYGVDDQDLLLETRSRNTYENAVKTRRLLAPSDTDRIVLVTDALHMPRAVACFRKQGFDVVPAASLYRTGTGFEVTAAMFLPHPNAARDLHRVLHEWLGLVYYRYQGWL